MFWFMSGLFVGGTVGFVIGAILGRGSVIASEDDLVNAVVQADKVAKAIAEADRLSAEAQAQIEAHEAILADLENEARRRGYLIHTPETADEAAKLAMDALDRSAARMRAPRLREPRGES